MENNKTRTIIISDVHGCYEELTEILNLVDAKSPHTRVICLGDFLDRGPDSVGVIRLARELDLECVLGNHEKKFLKWYKGNKYLDCHKHYTEFSDEDINYINRMPYYLKPLSDLWVVHAGVKPGLILEQQKQDDLIHLRYTDEDRNFISIKKVVSGKAPNAKFWTEFGPFGANIVYGHEVHSRENIRIDTFADGTACYGIDTGCCFGGRLTALIWETKETVQVQAKEEYYKGYFNRENKD